MKENNDGNDANVGSMEKSIEEDIKICEEKIKFLNKKYADEHGEDYYPAITVSTTFNARTLLAFENLLTKYKQYEQKLMFALTPTTHELALETQRNFKKIIAENINEDTYTIKRELKKYWNNMDTYWKE